MQLIVFMVCVAAATAAAVELPVIEIHTKPVPVALSKEVVFGSHLDRPQGSGESSTSGFGQHLDRPVKPPSTSTSGFGQHLDRPVTKKPASSGLGEHLDRPVKEQGREAKILKYEMINDPGEGYRYSYQTSDGVETVERNEEAQLKRVDEKTAYLVFHGNVDYKSKEGRNVKWEYTADENGYVPTHFIIS